jgi:hypothetical protein
VVRDAVDAMISVEVLVHCDLEYRSTALTFYSRDI